MRSDTQITRFSRFSIVAACLLLAGGALAQDTSPASGALQLPPQPNVEMQKWIETVDAQWQGAFAREVTEPYEAEKAKLDQQYTSGLDANLAKATSAGNLDLAVLWRNERDRFAVEKDLPVTDEPTTSAELKQLRTTWRSQKARLERDRSERTKSVHARYDKVLAQAQTQLTQRQRIDDALLVKQKRDEVALLWQTQPPAAAIASTSPAPMPPSTTPRPPLGTKLTTPNLAKVEAEGIVLSKLALDEKVFHDRDYVFTKVPDPYRDWQFTRNRVHFPYLRFKTLSEGIVYMACTARWGALRGSDAENDLTTRKDLEKKGWKAVKHTDFTMTGEGDGARWLIFSRPCKTGEEFHYRTEKYVAPILLIK